MLSVFAIALMQHFSASQTPMKAELLVAKKYPVVLRELHNQSSNQLSAQTTQDTPNATDLDSVAKAATAGVQAVSLTTQTDELLCLCSSCSSADSGIGALLLCDLACVGSASWRAAETLLAAAVQRLADLSVLLSRSHAANSRELLWISTIIAFVRNLQQLVSNVATNAIAGSVLPSVEGLFLLFRSSLPTLEAASLTAWSNAEVSLKETFHELSSSLASRQASSSGRHGSDYSSKTNTNNGVLQAYGHLLAALKHYQHVEFNVWYVHEFTFIGLKKTFIFNCVLGIVRVDPTKNRGNDNCVATRESHQFGIKSLPIMLICKLYTIIFVSWNALLLMYQLTKVSCNTYYA